MSFVTKIIFFVYFYKNISFHPCCIIFTHSKNEQQEEKRATGALLAYKIKPSTDENCWELGAK